jgi:hypothetical protein
MTSASGGLLQMPKTATVEELRAAGRALDIREIPRQAFADGAAQIELRPGVLRVKVLRGQAATRHVALRSDTPTDLFLEVTHEQDGRFLLPVMRKPGRLGGSFFRLCCTKRSGGCGRLVTALYLWPRGGGRWRCEKCLRLQREIRRRSRKQRERAA